MITVESWSVRHDLKTTLVSFSKETTLGSGISEKKTYSVTLEGEFTDLTPEFFNKLFGVLHTAGLATSKEELTSSYGR